MLHFFYQSIVESVFSSAIICWGISIRVRDVKGLNKLIKRTSYVLGTTVEPLETIKQRRIPDQMIKLKILHTTLSIIFIRLLYSNKVSSVRGFLTAAVIPTSTGELSCPQLSTSNNTAMKSITQFVASTKCGEKLFQGLILHSFKGSVLF